MYAVQVFVLCIFAVYFVGVTGVSQPKIIINEITTSTVRISWPDSPTNEWDMLRIHLREKEGEFNTTWLIEWHKNETEFTDLASGTEYMLEAFPAGDGSHAFHRSLIRTAHCPEGWFGFRNSCYIRTARSARQDEAVEACQALSPTAHLADPRTVGEYRFITGPQILPDGSLHRVYWIGIKVNSDGDAFYSDGTLVSAELDQFRVIDDKDDYECVALNPTGTWKWRRTQCVVNAHFICEYPVPLPPGNIQIQTEERTALVEWSSPQSSHGSRFTQYVVELREGNPESNTSFSRILTPQNDKISFDSIKSGHEYYVTVYTKDGITGESAKYPDTLFITNPPSVHIAGVGSDFSSVMLEWEEIEGNENTTFHNFTVEYRERDGEENNKLSVQDFNASITGLTSCTPYEVTVLSTVTYDTWYGSMTKRSIALESSMVNYSTKVSPVFNFRVQQNSLDETKFTLEWEPAVGELDFYQLHVENTKLEPLKSEYRINKSDTSSTVSKLSPGTRYYVSMSSIKEPFQPSSVTIEQTTRPRPVTEFQAITSKNRSIGSVSFNMRRSWTGDDIFDEYRIVFDRVGSYEIHVKNFNRELEQITFDGLTPGGIYTAYLYTVKDGVLSQPRKDENMLLQVAPPEDIRVLNQRETLLTLGWDAGEGDVTHFLILCESCPGNVKEFLGIDEVNTFTVQDLEPGFLYNFSVQAHVVLENSNTPSPPASEWANFAARTMPNAPGDIAKIEGNSTSQTLEWMPVEGYVDSYIVAYFVATSNPDLPQRSTIPLENGTIVVTKVNEPKILVVINDLVPGIEYKTVVNAVAGDARSSPTEVYFFTDISPLENIDIVALTEDSVEIFWDPGVGGYIFFQITVTDESTGLEKLYIVENTTLLIDSLKPGSLYYVSVVKFAEDAVSLPMGIHVQTRPSPVSDVEIYDVTETAFSVRWVPPKSPYDEFVVYLYDSGERSVELSSKTVPVSYVAFDGLQPGKMYSVVIQSSINSTVGNGVTGRVTLYPSNRLGVTLTGKTSTTLSIAWRKPEGGVGSYLVTWQPGNGAMNVTGQEETALDGLVPGVPYAITVYSRSEDNLRTSRAGDEITISTDEDYPGPPSNLHIEVVDGYSAKATWDPPKEPNGVILEYTLFCTQFYPYGTSEFVNSTAAEFMHIAPLLPGTWYKVQLMCINSKGQSLSSWTEDHFIRTMEDVPGRVEQLLVVAMGEQTLNVSWKSPLNPFGEITKYRLSLIEQEDSENFKVINFHRDLTVDPLKCYENGDELRKIVAKDFMPQNNTFDAPLFESWCDVDTRVENLQPYTTYNITVQAFTAAGAGQATSALQTTMEEIPSGPPRNITVTNLGPTFVTLSWQPPEFPNGEVTYLIEGLSTVPFVTSDTSYELSALVPFSVVSVSLAARTIAGQSEPTPFLLLNTTEDIPSAPVAVEGKVMNSESVYLTWQQPDDPKGIITSYHISIYIDGIQLLRVDVVDVDDANMTDNVRSTLHADTTLNENIPRQNESLLIDLVGSKIPEFSHESVTHVAKDLKPYTNYQFRIQGVTSAGLGESSYIEFLTDEDKPGSSPTNLTYFNLTSTSVRLSWLEPKDPNGEIISYSVMYLSKLSEMRTKVTNKTETVLENLLKNSPYSVFVNSKTAAGEGPSSLRMLMYTDEDEPESPPYNVKYFNVTPTAIRVQWSPPKIPNGIIQYYRVYYRNSSGEYSKRSDKEEAYLTNLKVYGEYSVQVTASTRIGDGDQRSIPLYVRTGEDQPGTPPHTLTYQNITATTVHINWHEPLEPNGVITHYEINVRSERMNENVTTPDASTDFILDVLQPDSEYMITIRAHTKIGDGGQISEPLKIYTMEDAPGSPPVNLTYVNISSSAVLLNWEEPEVPNGILTGYKVYYGLEGLHWSKTSVELSGLQPFSTYTVRVSALTAAGEGPNASILVHTEEDVPGSPPRDLNYTQISPTEIRLSWLPPLVPNGIIQQYSIHVQGSSSVKMFNTSKTEILISDLEVFSSYDASVISRTKIGYGEFSADVSFKTLEDAPGDPPQSVAASAVGPTSIDVSWDPPTQPNGDILFYKIYLRDDQNNSTTKKVSEGTSSTVDGLMKYTWYNITVTGHTILGDGGHVSEMIRLRTLPGAPDSGVENFRVVNISSDWVHLSWSEPTIKTGEFTYVLELISTDYGSTENYSFVGNTSELQYELSDLKPYTTYNVSVVPLVMDVEGMGPKTMLSFKTLEALPSQPVSDLRIVNITREEAIISWKPTNEPNGIITSYDIELDNTYIMSLITALSPVSDTYDVEILDLKPDQSYTVTVYPVNSLGLGPGVELELNTAPGVPEDAPGNVVVKDIEEHKATISWDDPSQPNGAIISYVIYYKDANNPNSANTLNVDGIKNDATLDDLKPFTMYSVTVKSGTKFGYGPSSDEQTFKTLEAEPSAPILNCTVLSQWDIEVSWLKPEKPNGVISQYMLQYRRGELVEEKFEKNFNDTMSYLIRAADPFTKYEITVWAENGAGYGEADSCSVLTPEGKPSAPQSLSSFGATSTSLSLKWKEPTQLNGVLSHYELHYKPGFSCWANGGELFDPGNEKLCVVKINEASKTLIALQSYSEYAVRIGAVTGGGLGELTPKINFKTETGAPDYPPRNLVANAASSTSVNVTWDEPYFFAGPTVYKAVAYLEDAMAAESEIVESEVFHAVIEGLKENTLYSVAVSAITSVGSKESKRTIVTTHVDAPSDPPAKLEILTEADNSSVLIVQFLPPRDPNGPLYQYSLQFKLGKEGDITTIEIFEEDLPYSDEFHMLQNHTITGLLGGRNYYFRMNAATLVGTGPWSDWTGPILPAINAPPAPSDMFTIIPPDAKQPQSTTTLGIRLCVFSEVNGPISNVTVIVVEDGGILDATPVHWFQAYEKSPSPPYSVLATDRYGDFCNHDGIQKRSIASPLSMFILGNDDSCSNKKEPFCNGPLKSNTAYRMKLRGTTATGDSTETEFSQPVKTHPTFLQANLYLLIGLLAGFGVVVFFVGIIIHHVRKRLHSRSFNESEVTHHSSLNKRTSGGVKSPSPVDNLSFVMEPASNSRKAITRPVAKYDFVAHVARMSENGNKGFLSELEEIASVTPCAARTIGAQSANAGKNRFIDIIPYDDYRVKIEGISSIDGSGYINASCIPGAHSPEQYIATQSPLSNTKNEFWKMIWETGCQTLIMLCNVEQDGNEEKISKYWPHLTQTCYYGNLGVQCSLEEKKPEWTVRTFLVVKRDQRRQVTQYHFTLWPLRGVPDNPQPFARFCQATRKSMRSSSGRPVVIMCSSGSGRSGVFIAYDMIVDALAKDNTVDPCGVVSELRNYRPFMVQTVVEYAFLHKCLAYSISKSSVRSPTGDGLEETTMF